MEENEAHRETQRKTQRKIIMDTISKKEATTQRDQELRTMEMLMANEEINGGKKVAWFILFLFYA